jgi:REP element-mobilizing transposase RayT
MARAPRLQIEGGVYHVTARGNRRQTIFTDDRDRMRFLALLNEVAGRLDWSGHAYCLMPNHFHLLVETPGRTLSRGLQRLNGSYAQWFNWRHGLSGHLFQGRFHSVLVETDAHLLELSRYAVQNPVRARLCDSPADWPWSSCRAMLGLARPADFLAVDRVLAHFGHDAGRARRAFHSFVHDTGPNGRGPGL